MLQVSGTSQLIPEEIELDDYTPLIIHLGETDFRLYWILSSKFTLLEIVIDSQTQIIHRIKVIRVNEYIQSSENPLNWDLPQQLGAPICNLDNWPPEKYMLEQYIKEEGTFEVQLGKSHISIVLAENTMVSQVVSGRVRFVLDANNYLCRIEVIDLTKEEMFQLKGTLDFEQSYTE